MCKWRSYRVKRSGRAWLNIISLSGKFKLHARRNKPSFLCVKVIGRTLQTITIMPTGSSKVPRRAEYFYQVHVTPDSMACADTLAIEMFYVLKSCAKIQFGTP